MKRRFTLFLSVFLLSIFSTAARNIQGTVLSEKDSTAVAGAICKLMTGDRFITGVAANESGEFEISTDIKDKLLLSVTMAGYSPTEVIIESDKSVNVGRIYLSDAITLEEVEVTANSMIDVRGNTVIFPSGADVKASSTAISLFQKLPLAGLEANPINRSLSVDGGSPVILINGIPSTLDDLNALQAKDIAKIEYSRITPARYADRGGTGFLNITLKQRNDGGEVYLWGRSAVNTTFVDGNIRASYHQGPSRFTLSYNPSWRNYQDVYDNSTESYTGNDFRVNLEEHDRSPFNYHTHNTALKYDYSPNINTLFSATFRISPLLSKRRMIANTIDSYLGDYSNDNLSKSKDLSPSLDLFFKRDFNEKNALEVQLVGTLSNSDYRRSNNYIFSDGTSEDYIMDVNSRRNSLISEISYIHQFSPRTSLSAGYQNTVSRSTNKYLTTDYKPVLTENNNYIYARFGQQVGRVYFSVSTGAKMYWIKNDVNKRHFIRNISTAQLSWNISQSWNIAAGFQYTPGIPSLSSLTDYAQQLSPYLISNGNPDLQTTHTFSYQLMPSFQYKKFSASLAMVYARADDFVMEEMRYLGNKMFLSQSVNAKRCWQTGASLYLKLSGIYGFGANVSIGVGHYETIGETWSHHLTSLEGSVNVWWNKGPFTISYWRKLPGKYLYGDVVGKEENGDNLSVEYRPDSHWTFGASWMYMFDRKGTKYPTWGYSPVNPYTKERYIKDNGNMIVLSVSYSADFGSIFRSSRRSLNNADHGSSLLKL